MQNNEEAKLIKACGMVQPVIVDVSPNKKNNTFNFMSKGFLKRLTIKTNGKNSRRFDRSSVIIKRNVENKNLHRYKVTKGQKYVRKMHEVKICKSS